MSDSIGNYLEQYTFDYLMDMALSNVDESFDKRQGSIIYDALSPCCSVLAEAFLQLRLIYEDTFIGTATGEMLDKNAQDIGMKRNPATYAKKRIDVADSEGTALSIPMGSRFSTISNDEPIIYSVESVYTDTSGSTVAGAYIAVCEELGTIGNGYTGELLVVSNIDVGTATMSTLITPAQDEESDDVFRSRCIARLNTKGFGGNVAQYNEILLDIDGVGECQVYPVWNGGGSVKVSIVDPTYMPVSNEFLTTVKNLLDPTAYEGYGMGEVPIGHIVTVTTPSKVTLNISASLTLEGGYTISSISEAVKAEIEKYLYSLRTKWGQENPYNEYSVTVYVSRIVYSILNVAGVISVDDVKINNSSEDVTLTENKTTQQIPVMGEVTLSAT